MAEDNTQAGAGAAVPSFTNPDDLPSEPFHPIGSLMEGLFGFDKSRDRMRAGMWASAAEKYAQSGMFEMIEDPQLIKELVPALGKEGAIAQQKMWSALARQPDVQFNRALREANFLQDPNIPEHERAARFLDQPPEVQAMITSPAIGQLSMAGRQLKESKRQHEESTKLQKQALDQEKDRMGMPSFQNIGGRGTLVYPNGKSLVVGGQPQFPVDNETMIGFSQMKQPLTWDQIAALDPNKKQDVRVIDQARKAGKKYMEANPDANAWRTLAAKEITARAEGKPSIPMLEHMDSEALSQMVVGMRPPNQDEFGRVITGADKTSFLRGPKDQFGPAGGASPSPTAPVSPSPGMSPTGVMTPSAISPTATPQQDAGQFPGATPGATYSQMLANAPKNLQVRDEQLTKAKDDLDRQLAEKKIDQNTYTQFVSDLQKDAIALAQEVMRQGSNAGQLGQSGSQRFNNLAKR